MARSFARAAIDGAIVAAKTRSSLIGGKGSKKGNKGGGKGWSGKDEGSQRSSEGGGSSSSWSHGQNN